VNGTRYRGSTKQTTQTRARQIEVRKMQEAQENGYSALPKKAPILRDFAAAVRKSFDNSSLDPDTKRYYRNGWSRIETTPLANMKLDRINGTRLQPMRSSYGQCVCGCGCDGARGSEDNAHLSASPTRRDSRCNR
jgi:hypothetical protein